MKVPFLVIALSFALGAAADFTEHCNTSGSYPGIPEGTCTIQGYLNNLAYDMPSPLGDPVNKDAVLSFHLMDDNKQLLTTSVKSGAVARMFYYIDGVKGSDALGTIMTATLALSAKNNKTLVQVIYTDDSENEAEFLISLNLLPD